MSRLGRILLALACAFIATSALPIRGNVTAASGPFTICAVQNNADHPSITAIINGMNDEARVDGAKITQLDPAGDPQKQAAMIQDCISRHPSVIAVNAVDPVAVIPSIQKAYNAHIPVIMFNADVAPQGHKYTQTFVGAQSYDQGYAVGLMVAKALHGHGNVVFITGNPGQTDTINRLNGVKAAWADQKAHFNILAIQTAHWLQDQAVTIMSDFLTRYPTIDAVIAQDDNMALGALQAIRARGKVGKILLYGVGGFHQACLAISRGEMAGTALQLSFLIGVYTDRAAYDLWRGRLIPGQILTPTAPVTKANVAQWMSQCTL